MSNPHLTLIQAVQCREDFCLEWPHENLAGVPLIKYAGEWREVAPVVKRMADGPGLEDWRSAKPYRLPRVKMSCGNRKCVNPLHIDEECT